MLDYKLQYFVCKYTQYGKLSQQNTNLFAFTSIRITRTTASAPRASRIRHVPRRVPHTPWCAANSPRCTGATWCLGPSLPTSCPHPTGPRSGRQYVVTTPQCRFVSKCPNHQTAGRAPVRVLLVEQGCCPHSHPSRWGRTTKDLLKAKRVRPDHVVCGWPHPFVRR